QTGGGSAIIASDGMSADTAITVKNSILDRNITDVIATENGRGVNLVNTQWGREYDWNYTDSWDGTTQIKENYGYLPNFVDTAGSPVPGVEIKALDVFGDVQFAQTSGGSGEITEQTLKTWQAERTVSGTSTTDFNPYTVTIKKYGKKFIEEAKTFAARTVETKQLETDTFTTLTEEQAQALTGITYTAPTKINWSDAETELVDVDNEIALNNTPITQSEFFGLYNNDAKTLIPSTDYAVNYVNGTVSFVAGYASTTVRAVYSHGGQVTLTNGTSTLSVDDLYAYLRLQKADVFTTVNGSDYTLYVDLVIGDETHSGSLVSPTKSITFASGFSYAFKGMGGYVDLGGLVVSGGTGSGGGLPLNISASTGSFYYPGEETAVFATVLNSSGQPVSATVNVYVYKPDGSLLTSMLAPEQITGFFKATTTLATSTPLGTYAVRILATYQGDEVQTNLAFKVLEAPSEFPPSVTVDAPALVKKDTAFVITAFVKSKSGTPIDCDSLALITIRDLIAQSDVVSSVQMSNFDTGKYAYPWSTASSTNYLAIVSCSVSDVSYVGVKEFSSQEMTPEDLNIQTTAGTIYAPGDEVNIYSRTIDGLGNLVSAVVTTEVYYPNGDPLTSGTSTEQTLGFFKFNFTLTATSSVGTYEVRTKAVYATSTAYDVDSFVVGEESRLLKIVSSVGVIYIPGETVNVYSTVYDAFNNLVSATTTVEVYDPDGDSLLSGTSTEQAPGLFKFSFGLTSTTSVGTYEVRTKAVYEDREAYHTVSFTVQKFTVSEWTVVVSDVDTIMPSKTYRAKVWILDNQSNPTDPYTTPTNATSTIIIYDAERTIINPIYISVQKLEIGIYEFTYTIPSNAGQGLWETEVAIEVEQGKTIKQSDYWGVSGSPADVKINAIIDNTVSDITASTTIDNKGSAGYEYHYEYCIVDTFENPCGGSDDIAYRQDVVWIGPEQNWTWTDYLTLDEVYNTGTYWFKLVVYWGTERSTAIRQFNAVSEVTNLLTVYKTGTGSGTVTSDPLGIDCGSDCTENYASGTLVALSAAPASDSDFAGWSGACSGTGICQVSMIDNKSVTATFNLKAPSPPPSGGGGGGGGGGGALPPTPPPTAPSCHGADFNLDGTVNSVDFSILLYFWNTNYPFKNSCVDINKDKKVNSVDFSILLYQWGGPGISFSKIDTRALLVEARGYGIIGKRDYYSGPAYLNRS
ncbi:MAG: hypothetical protein COS26_00685, partial [Candidatus Nealsonbacteria bacterium CG02_land_8_20_14_3_00_40_11]